MTDRTNLAAALLRDAIISGMRIATETPIEQVPAAIADVLAALSRAFDPAIAERAGEVVERLRGRPDAIEDVDRLRDEAADLITALLAQNAALRAERDGWKQWSENWRDSAQRCLAVAEKQEARATAAEAREERLRGALERIKADDQHQSEWRYWEKEDGYFAKIARAALTETATTEEGK